MPICSPYVAFSGAPQTPLTALRPLAVGSYCLRRRALPSVFC